MAEITEWTRAVGVKWGTSVNRCSGRYRRGGAKQPRRLRVDPGESALPLKTPSWLGKLTPLSFRGLFSPVPQNPGFLYNS